MPSYPMVMEDKAVKYYVWETMAQSKVKSKDQKRSKAQEQSSGSAEVCRRMNNIPKEVKKQKIIEMGRRINTLGLEPVEPKRQLASAELPDLSRQDEIRLLKLFAEGLAKKMDKI